jgi:methyl-accepting chemotaxis protein
MDPIFSERLAPGRESRLDIYLFFLAFLGGLLMYAALKLFGFGQLSQTAAIVSTMFLYAGAVAKVPRLRVRLDQAGDNAYYLGLLFTLISMAVTLYEFSGTALGEAGAPARSGVEQIIANFGVALASTIAGIFLRVLLHQMRVDPGDVEGMTRIELGNASKRVKAQLDEVSGNLALFQGQAAQRMNDVIASAGEAVNETLTTFTHEVGGAMVELLRKTEAAHHDVVTRTATATEKLDAMAESARSSIDRLKEIAPPPQRLVTRLDNACDSLHALAAPIQAIASSLKQTADEVAKAIRQIGDAAAQLETGSRLSREQHELALRQVAEAAEQFRLALGGTGETLRREKATLAELESQARSSSAEVKRLHEAANKVLQTFTEVTQELAALVRTPAKPSQGDTVNRAGP